MKILIPDKVDKAIISILEEKGHKVEYTPGIEDLAAKAKDYDALIVRSLNLHEIPLDNVLAVGRAGAGTNNIPVKELQEKGAVVFNTPGANANAVAELVISNMIIASRNLYEAMRWTDSIEKDLSETVEKGKKHFKGKEIIAKTLGVMGLGKIGVLVAKKAHSLGLEVVGYDPYVTDEVKEEIKGIIEIVDDLKKLFKKSDFITIHVPFMEATKNLVNEKLLKESKQGMILLNFARGEIVDNKAILSCLKDGRIAKYVTDFPSEEIKGKENIVMVPHLGASTSEAEENCAIMIGRQIHNFLIKGNIINSVNYPNAELDRNGTERITIFHKNVPGMIGKISDIFGKVNINIANMIDKSRGDYAYYIGDVEGSITEDTISDITSITGVIKVRKI